VRVDESQGSSEHRKQHPQLRSRRVAEARQIEILAFPVDVAAVDEGEQAEGTAQDEVVLDVELVVLVAAEDGLGEGIFHRVALGVAQEDRAEAVAADAVLTAQVETLQDRDRPPLVGVDPAGLDVDREDLLDRAVEGRQEEAVGRFRPPEVVVAAQEAAGVFERQAELLPLRRLERIVPAVEAPHRPQRGVVDPRVRGDRRPRLRVGGRRRRRGLRHHEARLVVVVRAVEADARRLEQLEVAPVGEDGALAVADQTLVVGVEPIIDVLLEGADADALRLVEEPGDRVRQVEVVAVVAVLVGQADLLAAAEEVLGFHRELAEEAVQLAPAAAELQLRTVRLRAFEREVDLFLLAVGGDLDRIFLVQLEVAELVDLEDAVADRPDVHQAAFPQAELTAQHLVHRPRVAFELDAPDAELVALGDVDDHVGDPVRLLHQLRLHLGVDVARVVVEVGNRLDAVVDQLLAQPGALTVAEDAGQRLVRVDLVAFDLDLAELPALALLDRDGEEHAAVLVLDRLGVGVQRLDRDLRVADDDVLVAGGLVQLADLVQVLLQLRRIVDVLLEDAGDDPALLRVGHHETQVDVVVDRVAFEVDVLDADAVPLVDREADLLLVVREVRDRVARLGEAIALLGVELLDQRLDPLQLAETHRLALADVDALGRHLVLEV